MPMWFNGIVTDDSLKFFSILKVVQKDSIRRQLRSSAATRLNVKLSWCLNEVLIAGSEAANKVL